MRARFAELANGAGHGSLPHFRLVPETVRPQHVQPLTDSLALHSNSLPET